MPKGVANKRYTPEFKKLVIETMQEEELSYSETCRRFEVNSRDRIKSWERIFWRKGRKALPSNGAAAAAPVGQRNNRRIKAKRKGLPPAIHRQQDLSAA